MLFSGRSLSKHLRFLMGCSLCLLVVSPSIAQTMASDDSAFIKIRLVRAREIKAANIWTSTGTAQNPTMGTGTYHVMAYTYRHMTGTDLNGDASNFTSGGGGGIGPPIGPQSLVEGGLEPPGGGENPPPPTPSGSDSYYLSIPGVPAAGGGMQGFLQDSSISPNAYPYIKLVPNILSIYGYLTQTDPNEPPLAAAVPGLRVKLLPGQEVTVCYYNPSFWKLYSGFGQVMVTHASHYWNATNIAPPQGTSLNQQEVYYSIDRTDGFEDAAVDSRKGYGQPNREGQFPADANAELRNINFGDWVYKGGMFAGNMPTSGSNDRSGTARFQLWQQTANANNVPRMMVATVYQAGKPTNVNGAMTLGIFAPLPGPDVYIGEAATTWANKWNIIPRASIPTNGSYEQNKDPWRKFTIGASDEADLLSVSLTKVYDAQVSNGMGGFNNLTTWSTPIFDGLCYALDNEQSQVDSNFTGWRYFASKEFTINPEYRELVPGSFKDFEPRYWHFFIDTTYQGISGQPFPLYWAGWN